MSERHKLEAILTTNKLVSEEQLKQIASYAHAVGIDLHEAILQKKIAPPDAIMMAYAESVGLPFICLDDVSIDEEVVAQIDPMTARKHSFIPISIDHGLVLLAATKPIIPDVAEEIRMTFGLPVRCVLCTPAELNTAIATYYPRGAIRGPRIEQEQAPKPVPEVKKASVKKPEPAEPMHDEDIKNRALMSFVTFNFSFAFVSFALHYLQFPRGLYNTYYHFPVIVLLGIIVGGLAAFAMWRKLSH